MVKDEVEAEKEVVGGKSGGNPNWPSTTGNPSGGGRGNNPPSNK